MQGNGSPALGGLSGRTGGRSAPWTVWSRKGIFCGGTGWRGGAGGSLPSSEVQGTHSNGSSARPRPTSCWRCRKTPVGRSSGLSRKGKSLVSQRTYRLSPQQADLQWFGGGPASPPAHDAAVRRAGNRHSRRPVRRTEVPLRPPALHGPAVRCRRFGEKISRRVATGPTKREAAVCIVIPLLFTPVRAGGDGDLRVARHGHGEQKVAGGHPAGDRAVPLPGAVATAGRRQPGGRVESIQFRNGATLKYMSGGGSDKSRGGFTSRVVVITETDGMDQPGQTSRESDKITQSEARIRPTAAGSAFIWNARSAPSKGGPGRSIRWDSEPDPVPCPGCQRWVARAGTPYGWQGAETR